MRTASLYDNNLISLVNVDFVIDKYQTGVTVSTTCGSPTDAVSD